MTDDLTIPGFLRRDEVPGHVCGKCGDAAEFGYKIEGVMQWFCDTHRLAKHYADARVPKAAEPAPRNDPLAEHASAIRVAGKRAVLEIGHHLAEAKEICEHGDWLEWLKREFNWSRQTADNFINVYKMNGKVPNFSTSGLPTSALYLLAAPNAPPEAREEVFDRVESGEKLSYEQVKDTIAKAKKPPLDIPDPPPTIPRKSSGENSPVATRIDLPPNHKQIAAGLTLARQMSLATLDEFLVGLRQLRREKKRHANSN